MKTIKKQLLIATLSFLTIAAVLQSCKKTNLDGNTETINENAAIERMKQNVAAQIKADGGINSRTEVNQRLKMDFVDKNGNIIPANKLSQNNLTSSCMGDLPDYIDLQYLESIVTCGQGAKIKVTFAISWNNNIVTQNPFNTSLRTRGLFRIGTPSNNNVYSNTSFNVQIVDGGVDPGNSSNNIYYVTSTTTTMVPNDVLKANNAVLRVGGVFVSDCNTQETTTQNLSPTGIYGYGFETPLEGNPCSRNDRAYYQQPGTYANNRIAIAGYDVLGSCPSYSEESAPSYQRVQYSINNGVWTSFQNNTSLLSNIIGSGVVSRTDFARSEILAPGTYNVRIRYANTKLKPNFTLNTVPSEDANSCIYGGWPTSTNPNTIVWTTETYLNQVVN